MDSFLGFEMPSMIGNTATFGIVFEITRIS